MYRGTESLVPPNTTTSRLCLTITVGLYGMILILFMCHAEVTKLDDPFGIINLF